MIRRYGGYCSKRQEENSSTVSDVSRGRELSRTSKVPHRSQDDASDFFPSALYFSRQPIRTTLRSECSRGSGRERDPVPTHAPGDVSFGASQAYGKPEKPDSGVILWRLAQSRKTPRWLSPNAALVFEKANNPNARFSCWL